MAKKKARKKVARKKVTRKNPKKRVGQRATVRETTTVQIVKVPVKKAKRSTMGSLTRHISAARSLLENQLGAAAGKVMRAKTKTERKKLQKKVNEISAKLRRLP